MLRHSQRRAIDAFHFNRSSWRAGPSLIRSTEQHLQQLTVPIPRATEIWWRYSHQPTNQVTARDWDGIVQAINQAVQQGERCRWCLDSLSLRGIPLPLEEISMHFAEGLLHIANLQTLPRSETIAGPMRGTAISEPNRYRSAFLATCIALQQPSHRQMVSMALGGDAYGPRLPLSPPSAIETIFR